MSLTKDDFIKAVEGMTVMELNDLVGMLKEKFGVSAMPVAGAVGGAVGSGDADVEEKSSFNLVLKNAGGNKISVIKEVKAITGLGLKEAKELVDNPSKAIKENVPKDEAMELKKKLEDTGAEVELT